MSALAAGVVSFVMIATFISMLEWIFIPSVMLMVFIAAYFSFRRQMRNHGELTSKRIFSIAMEVGTVTHFYTFAFYLPFNYFISYYQGISGEIVGGYLVLTLLFGISSLVAFVWIAVLMYMSIGHLLKSMEVGTVFTEHELDNSILDDEFAEPTGKQAFELD